MKKLNITKEQFEKSKYFKNKYGKLEYVSESGKVFKTDKGKLLKFKESKEDLKEDKPNSPDFKSWAEVEREIRAAIKYAEHKGHEACTVFDIGTWDQRNNKNLQKIIAKFEAKGYSFEPYPEEGSGYGIIDDGLGLSIVWGRFLGSGGMKWRKFKESTKKFGRKFNESDELASILANLIRQASPESQERIMRMLERDANGTDAGKSAGERVRDSYKDDL